MFSVNASVDIPLTQCSMPFSYLPWLPSPCCRLGVLSCRTRSTRGKRKPRPRLGSCAGSLGKAGSFMIRKNLYVHAVKPAIFAMVILSSFREFLYCLEVLTIFSTHSWIDDHPLWKNSPTLIDHGRFPVELVGVFQAINLHGECLDVP